MKTAMPQNMTMNSGSGSGSENKLLWILEDDDDACFVYREALSPKYDLQAFKSLEELKTHAMQAGPGPDLLIADLSLPDGNFLNYLKSTPQVKARAPFMVVSGLDEIDLLRGCFEEGAIDYISKPFNQKELLVKLERFFARQTNGGGFSENTQIEGVEIDPIKVSVTRAGHGQVTLTAKELQIFAILKRDSGRYVARNSLIKEIWGDTQVSAKTLDVHLFNLRKKISELGLEILYTHPKGFILIKSD